MTDATGFDISSSGLPGPAGTQLRYGARDPTSTDGNDGDFWLNDVTMTMFGPKASGAWPAGASLTGEAAAALAAAARAEAARDTALSAPIEQILPPTEGLIIDGEQPNWAIGAFGDDGRFLSAIAQKLSGPLVSDPLAAFILAKVAGLTFETVTVSDWVGVFVGEYGDDGRLLVLSGTRADGTSTSGPAASYPKTAPTPLPIANYPAYTASGLNAVITYGQSLSNGGSAQNALSLTQPYSNLTFGSGVRSSKPGNTAGALNSSPGTTTLIPLVESDSSAGSPAADGSTTAGETICTGMTNAANRRALKEKAISPANFRHIASAAGHGAEGINFLNSTSAWWANLIDHVTQGKARADALGIAYVVSVVPYMQGETDAGSGMASATWTAALIQMRTDIDAVVRSITGQTAPVHMLLYQTPSNPSTTLANLNLIQQAQIDAVNQSPFIHFVGPIYFMPLGIGVHLTDFGQLWFSEYMGRAEFQLVHEHNEPECIWPVSASYVGQVVSIKLRVPQPPLVFDDQLLNRTPDWGIAIKDDSGRLTLSNIQIVGDGDVIQATVNRALVGSPVARIAMDDLAPGVVITNGATCNIHDSTVDPVLVNGVAKNLENWCPAFQLALQPADQ